MRFQIRFDWGDHMCEVLPRDEDAKKIDPSVREFLVLAGPRYVGQKFGEREINTLAHELLAFLYVLSSNSKHPWEQPEVEVVWAPPPCNCPEPRTWTVT